VFYLGKGSSALRFLDPSSELLLFLSNNWLISGFVLLISHRPAAYHLDLIFLAIKASSLAL
jgi:hypothetical protein